MLLEEKFSVTDGVPGFDPCSQSIESSIHGDKQDRHGATITGAKVKVSLGYYLEHSIPQQIKKCTVEACSFEGSVRQCKSVVRVALVLIC